MFNVAEGQKVVAANEMARIEGLAYAKGAIERDFMENAGRGIAAHVEEYIKQHKVDKHVVLLVGKGNNGGDAYTAGKRLIERGYTVVALHLFSLDSCGPLCQEQHRAFKQMGGAVEFLHQEKKLSFPSTGIILDGLVGTGFKGKAEGILSFAIEAANASKLPIIAIDIPSGVNGNTGEVGTIAIKADLTIYLGLPKIGFFIGQGWNHIGKLVGADFGLSEEFIAQAKAQAYLLNEEILPALLPPIEKNRHKYQAGYVLAIAGSKEMSGAALLSTSSVLRAGAGIVRLFYPFGMEVELAKAPYELIKEGWDFKHFERIEEESKRAKAALIGPGLGRSKIVKNMLKQLLKKTSLPCVIDADALYFLAENPSWVFPEQALLTPHHKEMERLLGDEHQPKNDLELHSLCQQFVEKKKTTLILKGGPTCIFDHRGPPLFVLRGDPGMATAGTGDVLTGILAALLAQKLPLREAAILGVYLHGRAGEIAASKKTSYSLIASDLIENLSEAFSSLLIHL